MRNIDAAINAGIKACDLYKIAAEDIISRNELQQFLVAAIAEYEKRKARGKGKRKRGNQQSATEPK